MNLISCNLCGVVLNKDQLDFPQIWEERTGELIEGTYEWNGVQNVAVVPCPVCGDKWNGKILKED